jgi:hypothetical protein
MKYRGWRIIISSDNEFGNGGYYYHTKHSDFVASNDGYDSPESAEHAAKVLVDLLEDAEYLG